MRSIGISEIAWRGLVLALLCMATAAPSWAQINFPRTVRVDSTSIDPVQGSVATASIRFDPGNVGPTYQVRTRLIVPGFIVDVAAQPISASTTCTAQLIVSPTSRVWHVDVVAVKSRCSEIFCLVPSPYGNERLCDVTFTGTQFITSGQFSLDLAADQTSCDDQWVTVARSAAKTPVFCSTSDGALTARGASFGSSPSIGTPIVFDNVTTSTPRLRQLNLTNSGTYQAAVQLSGLKAPLSASPVSLVVPANDDFVVDIACAAPVPVVVAGVVTDIDQVLTATISHDPNRSQANYPVKCKRIAPPIGLDPFASTPTANGASRAVAMDASGSSLVFESVATNLLASADADGADIFLFDAPTGNIQMASLDNEEASVTTAVMEPSLSAQGDLVAFVTADAGVKRLLGESEKQSERRRKAGGFSVYLRDRISGTTQRVGGAMPGGVGTTPRLAPDGLSLVLVSPATSTEGVPDQANVYRVKLPRVGGIPQPDAPDCLSCKVDDGNGRKGSLNANGVSNSPVVSASGEWVAWETTATNTVLGQAPLCGNTQVILRNAISGATQRISAPTSATQCASGGSRKPSIDYAGRKLVFESDLPLGDGDSAAPGTHAYYVDLTSPVLTPVRVSTTAQGAPGNGSAEAAVISGDGETVAYVSTASNLDASGLTGGNGKKQVHVARLAGGKVQGVMRVSRAEDSGFLGDEDSQRIALDYSGRRVAYDSASENLGNEDAPVALDVFVQDNPLNPDKLFRAGFE